MRESSQEPVWLSHQTLLAVVGVMLVYLFLRIHNLLVFPPFLDEVDHIKWARDLYDFHPFTGAANGKLFGLWWMALFGLSGDGVLWVVRAATIVFGALGLATTFSLGRYFVSTRVGLMAAALYALSPILFFYDRLALVDPYVTTWGLIAMWFSVRFASRGQSRDAVLRGVALAAAILAKATGLMLAVIPALAVWLQKLPWRIRIRGVTLSYSVLAVIWVPFYVLLVSRGFRYFNTATTVVGTDEAGGLVGRLVDNLRDTLTIEQVYFSWPFLALVVVGAVYYLLRRPRAGLFLLLTTAIPLVGLLSFANKLSPRYMLFHVPGLILLLATGVGLLAADVSRRATWLKTAIPVGVVVVWGGLFALPFMMQYWRDPAGLSLPDLDRLEYITSDAAGFALEDTANYLLQRSHETSIPVVVVGLLANCGGLDLYIPQHSQVIVDCPYITLDGSQQATIARSIDSLAANASVESPPFELWIALENSPFISLDGITAAVEPVTVFERPDNLTRITLYRVSTP
jgi:hypothetical protein